MLLGRTKIGGEMTERSRAPDQKQPTTLTCTDDVHKGEAGTQPTTASNQQSNTRHGLSGSETSYIRL